MLSFHSNVMPEVHCVIAEEVNSSYINLFFKVFCVNKSPGGRVCVWGALLMAITFPHGDCIYPRKGIINISDSVTLCCFLFTIGNLLRVVYN